MIHYALRCAASHEFEGWFADSGAFDAQSKRGLVECPHCGSAEVSRGLMAPAVTGRALAAPAPEPKRAPPRLPAEVTAALQKLRAAVEANCEDVGSRFTDEALQMHRGEIEQRGIYGQASPEQAEALHDEGVEISRLPWVRRADG